jgi:trimeric autotransporter adhesin
MSTKTTFKRIALVAVAALMGGLLSVTATPVANAIPADRNNLTAVGTGSVTSTFKVARVGQAYTSELVITSGSARAAVGLGSTLARVNALYTAVPAGDSVNVTVAAGSGTVVSPTLTASHNATLFTGSGTATTVSAVSGSTPAALVVTAGSANTVAGSTVRANVGTFAFTPNVAGAYRILFWSDDATAGNTLGSFDAQERSASITVTAGGVPTAVAIKAVATSAAPLAVGSATTFSNAEGAGYIITLTDALGNRTIPGVGEALAVTSSNGTVSDASLTTSDFNTLGQAFVQVHSGAKGLSTLTVTPAGAISGITAVTDSSVTFGDAPTAAVSKLEIRNLTGVALGAGSSLATITGTGNTATFAVGTALSLRVHGAGGFTAVQVQDTSAGLTGFAGATWTVPVTVGSTLGYGAMSLATTGISAGSSVVVNVLGSAIANHTITFTAAAAALDATGSALSPAAASLVTGGGATVTLTAVDQFGSPVVGAAVSWSRAGRNVTTVSTANTTDALGTATYTYTDASTSTTSLTDTITAIVSFNGASITETATVTFGGSNVVGSLTVTASPTLTSGSATSAINTSASGADATAQTVSVTARSATGILLGGVPVVFTTSNAKTGVTNAAVATTTTTNTAYTNSSGVATATIYGWVAPGSTTVTATAGAVSATTTVNFVNAAADARYIAVTAAGGLVSATVTDRYGNGVPSATVTWAVTGGGYFGNGTTGTTGTTNRTGVAQIILNGSGAVTASLDATYTQAYDIAGQVNATAIVATGVGATFNTAGVNTATVEVTGVDSQAQAAADAAAEATDAANAATDAANAAAEAADAATAAAQDAADAVAALSTQVSEMVNALKKQITALTNLVIKIQKKVRA